MLWAVAFNYNVGFHLKKADIVVDRGIDLHLNIEGLINKAP